MSNESGGCARTQRDVRRPANNGPKLPCRTDSSNSTNLVLTRGSVRLCASSPEASLGFLFSGLHTSEEWIPVVAVFQQTIFS